MQNVRVYYTPPVTKASEYGTVLVCHHGAWYSGLTKEVTELSKTELGILAFDASGTVSHFEQLGPEISDIIQGKLPQTKE